MRKIYKTSIEAATYDEAIVLKGFLKQGRGGFNFSFNIDPGIDANGFITFLDELSKRLKTRVEPYNVAKQLKVLGKTLDRHLP